MSSDYLAGYVPVTPAFYAIPVQDESAAYGLTGCETPDGHGVLTWVAPGQDGVRFALLDSPLDFIVNDIVPSADMGDVITGVDFVYGACCFSAIGEVFCVINYWLTADVSFHCEIYMADDPNNPVTWSVYSTPVVIGAVGPSPTFGSAMGQSVPLILDSGRWVFGTKVLRGTPFTIVEVRIWTSDDDGLTWDLRLTFEHNVFPAGRTELAAGQMAHDPISGDIWWRSGTTVSSADMNIPWRSADDGDTWTHGTSDLTSPGLNPSIQNGTNVYAMASGGEIYTYDGSGVEWSDWDDSGENWAAAGVTFDGIFEMTYHMNITSLGVFWFVRNQVMFTPGIPVSPFTIPLLHIPFKDRLMNVKELLTDGQ